MRVVNKSNMMGAFNLSFMASPKGDQENVKVNNQASKIILVICVSCLIWYSYLSDCCWSLILLNGIILVSIPWVSLKVISTGFSCLFTYSNPYSSKDFLRLYIWWMFTCTVKCGTDSDSTLWCSHTVWPALFAYCFYLLLVASSVL